ncbi:MAG: hypothetical protein OQK12_02720 [Motiliproteus sp.]|nr:hypothetical protein [Motiliproteus sp.]MCW9051242.1 hypothetical protein [Motiliproteus sp.]
MSATERFYKSSPGLYENVAIVEVSIEGNATPLDGVTRITCELQPSGETVDSDASPTAITWQNDGAITLDFAEHTFAITPSGIQRCKLIAFDPSHLNGQVIAHRNGGDNNQLTLIFEA